MNADELIHLISNQALNQNVKEQHKLVIQDCCKELFNKKNTIAKYKKITYLCSKSKYDAEDDEHICMTRTKTRIVEIVGADENMEAFDIPFPEKLHHKVLERLDQGEKYISFHNLNEHQTSYTILEVEDI